MAEVAQKKCWVWLVVAGCIIGAVGGADGAVLCISDDGHVAIEHADEACCDGCACETHDEGRVPEPAGVHRPERACGPCCGCIDIPVNLGGAEYDLASACGPETAALLPSVASLVAIATPRPDLMRQSPRNPVDVSPQTVCLRI